MTVYLRRNLFAILFVAAVAAPVVGQEADLQWKFTKDKKFYQEMKTDTKQTMKVMGTDVAQTQDQTFYFEWTPTSELKDGIVTLEQKIIGLKMNIDIGGSKITYNSMEQQQGANPLNKFFDALKTGKFTLTVDLKKREIKEFKGAKEFVEELTKANPQMKPLLEKILSEQSLKEMSLPMFAALPGKKVTKGKEPDATWTYKSDMDMGPIGKYTTTYTYKYDGPDTAKKLEKITVTSDLKYTPPDQAAGVGLPFRIKEAKLDAKDSTGTILYDPVSGMIKSSEMSLTLAGTLTVEIGQQSTTVELTQTQKTTITTTDKDPTVKQPATP